MSPRPRKPRHCQCPFREAGKLVFKPAGTPLKDLDKEVIFEDEMEAVRLCDSEGLTQQEAGERMGVSRGTVQRLVASGRKKIVDAMTQRRALVGGRRESS
ncbi:DUF134 domain-containing protein [uncultured Desulfuromonas sp.]|uniref:DUF134 domain-containing protein n=1 Tax=uncultured Desulfuromonas sp. TaxID=181013 RepID=UPI00261B0337|nr:DUF134 domain-containing protein [uncultured Desulfuromonas sp.]